MKKLIRPALMIGLSLALALLSAAMTYSAGASPLPQLTGASLFFQTTPTPPVADQSEMGSTDEIIMMSAVIVFIIFAPIFISRKTWQQSK